MLKVGVWVLEKSSRTEIQKTHTFSHPPLPRADFEARGNLHVYELLGNSSHSVPTLERVSGLGFQGLVFFFFLWQCPHGRKPQCTSNTSGPLKLNSRKLEQELPKPTTQGLGLRIIFHKRNHKVHDSLKLILRVNPVT